MAWFFIVTMVLTLLLIVMGVRLHQSLRRFGAMNTDQTLASPPTVSVCIPARNEMHAMSQCLERVLASDYEKLEIVVYDDRSKDDTSYVIKSFAQAGVRFVPGRPLPKGWLGRNYALEVLAEEASGDYLLFIGVDTFIKPTTISQLMRCAAAEDLAMVSVIPGRNDTWRASVLFGHLRYFWDLILARPSWPATASSLWMIRRQALDSASGGFKAAKASVQPEADIAKAIGRAQYRCLLGVPTLGVTYEKRWVSQIETGKRLLWPMVGGRWLGAAAGLAALILLNVPTVVLITSVFLGWSMMSVMALWLSAAYMALYAVYTSRLWQGRWWLGGLLWPVVIFQELVLFILSVAGYWQGTITWKGRSVLAQPLRADRIAIDR